MTNKREKLNFFNFDFSFSLNLLNNEFFGWTNKTNEMNN
jgi:hypothetical protein